MALGLFPFLFPFFQGLAGRSPGLNTDRSHDSVSMDGLFISIDLDPTSRSGVARH